MCMHKKIICKINWWRYSQCFFILLNYFLTQNCSYFPHIIILYSFKNVDNIMYQKRVIYRDVKKWKLCILELMKHGIILERCIGNDFRNSEKEEVTSSGEIRGSCIQEVEYTRSNRPDRIWVWGWRVPRVSYKVQHEKWHRGKNTQGIY